MIDPVLGAKRQAQNACARCGKYDVPPGQQCTSCGIKTAPIEVPKPPSRTVKQPAAKPKTHPFKRPEVVEIEWVDTMGYSGWNDRSDRIRTLDRVEEMDHVSTGYVLKRAPKYIALTQSIGRAGSIGDTIQIPRSAVRRVTVLRKATDS